MKIVIRKDTSVLLLVFYIFLCCHLYSQENSEIDVFVTVLEHEIQKGKVLLSCQKEMNSFSKADFLEQSILSVPEVILNEIQVSSKMESGGVWEIDLKKLTSISYGLTSENCLSKDEIDKQLDTKKKRQRVLIIDRPNFDDKKENCIVSIAYQKFHKSIYGQSYFLKRVYGKWVIIETFNSWMS